MRNLPGIFSAVLLLVMVQSGTSQAQSLVNSERVDAALESLVKQSGLVGVSALIYERGQEAYFGAYGFADRENNRLMKRDTLAYIYSMTKPITGVALMKLYEQGKFRLDDPLAKYAPEFANLKVYAGHDQDGNPVLMRPKRAPTIRDIARHTAGFSRGSAGNYIAQIYASQKPGDFDNTLTQFAEKLGQVPLEYHPGERWLYGDSVDVQAFLVERISGQKFDEFLKTQIFEPLGMLETAYYFGPEYEHRRTRIYERNRAGAFELEDEQFIAFNQMPRTLKPGGYGLISTVDDYMRFARMLLNQGELDGKRILKPETVRLMSTNALPATLTDSIWLPSKGQVGFGIDFAVRIASPASSSEASGEIGEFFWDGRASTLFWVDPQNEIAAVLFTQMVPFNTLPVHKTFRDAIYWDDESAAAPRN